MNSAIVFLALIGAAYGGVISGLHAPAVLHAGIVNTGASSQFRSQDNIGNYAFGYNEDHSTGGTFRRESGGPGHQVGSYGLRDADGRVRVVNYVADGAGFRANIQTNEPGVDSSRDPAAVLINKAAAIVAPAYAAAPVAVGAYAAAPLAVAHGAYAAGPVGYAAYAPQVSSYSVATQHVAAGPAVVAHAAPLVAHASYGVPALAAPVAYATKTIQAPLAGW